MIPHPKALYNVISKQLGYLGCLLIFLNIGSETTLIRVRVASNQLCRVPYIYMYFPY